MVLIVAALSPDFSHCGALKLKAHTHKQDTRRGIKRFRGLNKLNGDYFYCGPRRLAKRGDCVGENCIGRDKEKFFEASDDHKGISLMGLTGLQVIIIELLLE